VSGRFGRDIESVGVRALGGPPGVDSMEDRAGLADTVEPLGPGGPIEAPRWGGIEKEELVLHVSHDGEGV